MKKVFGQIGKLKANKVEEYKRLHAHPWKQVLKTIKDCNLQNYHIFVYRDIAFSYFEYTGDDYDADMAKMAECPATQEWWTHTKPCFEKYYYGKDGEFYLDMEEIFNIE